MFQLCMASIQLLRVHSISTPCSVEKDGKDKKKPAAVILNSSPSEPMKLITAVVKDGPSETMESTESMASTNIVTTSRFW